MTREWDTIIGLEVHVQLSTNSKLFSGAPNKFGGLANSQANLIDLGYPGTLPVVNEEAIRMALKLGLALKGKIPNQTTFSRKNYFYPDLPKGYQISQFNEPIISGGSLTIETKNEEKIVHLIRAHLEEDAGKSVHLASERLTGIDLNRAGTPLIEVVTEPQMVDAEEAVSFMKTLRELVRHLRICDGNMQEGSFRCDANISVKRKTEEKLGTKVEIKNLNSFKFVENAINFEIKRQIEKLEAGGIIKQETRLYNEKSGETKIMRTKEDENDYRYFPDPDLIPISIDESALRELHKENFELPLEKRKRYKKELELNQTQSDTILADPELTAFFDESLVYSNINSKLLVNWVTGELMKKLNEENIRINQANISVKNFVALLTLIDNEKCSQNDGRKIFRLIWENNLSLEEAREIVLSGKEKFTDEDLTSIIRAVLSEHPNQVEQYLNGKEKVLGFLIGQVMQKSEGKADPKIANEIMKKELM